MKPGQRCLTRQYYDRSTRNVPNGTGYTANYKRFDSTYGEFHNKNVQPKDYLEPNVAKNFLSKTGISERGNSKLRLLARAGAADPLPHQGQPPTFFHCQRH